MQTLHLSTHSRYTLAPTRDVGALRDLFAKIDKKIKGKFSRPAIKSDTRAYPNFHAAMSTAEYVNAYAVLNDCRSLKAWDWAPMTCDPCTLYTGADTCETLPDGFESWEDFDAAQSMPTIAPESAPAAPLECSAPIAPETVAEALGAAVVPAPVYAPDVPMADPADIGAALARGLDRQPIAHLPLFARIAIERLDADSGLRNSMALGLMLQAYARTYGTEPDDSTRASAHYICGRRFWDFAAAPDDAHGMAGCAKRETIEPAAPVDPAPAAAPVARQSRDSFDRATIAAADTLARLTALFPSDSTRRKLIEGGRHGAIGARAGIVAELKRLSESTHWHGSREAKRALETLAAADPAHPPATHSDPAPSADPLPVDSQRADDGEFLRRVNLAAAYMGLGRKSSRKFDSCFEMWDGDAVAVALMRRAEKRPATKLAVNLWRYLSRDTVEAAALRQPAGLTLAEWSRELVAKGSNWEPAREAAPVAAPLPTATGAGLAPLPSESASPVKPGARVTVERSTYFDGQPVAGWPHAQFLGTVRDVFDNRGLECARVQWDSGRREIYAASNLQVIDPLPGDTQGRCMPPVAPTRAEYVASFKRKADRERAGPRYDAQAGAAIEAGRLTVEDAEARGVGNGTTWPAHRAYLSSQAASLTLDEYLLALGHRNGLSGPENAAWYEAARRTSTELPAADPVPPDTQPAAPVRPSERRDPCRYAMFDSSGAMITWSSSIRGRNKLRQRADDYSEHSDGPFTVRKVTRGECDAFSDAKAAPLDGLDVSELGADGLAEFERAQRDQATAPAYVEITAAGWRDPGPVLRILDTDPRARIPARFAPVYLLQA